jgi:replicative DNA helicase
MQANQEFLQETTIPEAPSHIEAEQGVLGAILARNDTLFQLPADLRAEHFYEPLHQRIFTVACEAIEKGHTVDALMLRKRFDGDPALADIGGGAYLAKLVGASFAVMDAPACARQIIDLAERRKIIAACQQAIFKAHDFSVDSSDVIARLSGELENNDSPRYHIISERQISEKILNRVKGKKTVERFQTGIAKLDTSMDGGMYANKLYGIVGRKKMGKTMLAGTISTNLQKSGTKHLYIALEMGSEEIHQRNLARELNCFESAFRTGFIESDSCLNRLGAYAANAKNYRLYLDAPGITFSDLKHILPLYIRKYKISGFILDCWQLVGGKTKGQSTAEHQDNVAQWLAEIVKKYPVWGLVTAQENQDENTRGGEGIRLACDQLYRLCKRDESSSDAWLEMMETRYTKWHDAGSEMFPAMSLNDKFTHFENT